MTTTTDYRLDLIAAVRVLEAIAAQQTNMFEAQFETRQDYIRKVLEVFATEMLSPVIDRTTADDETTDQAQSDVTSWARQTAVWLESVLSEL